MSALIRTQLFGFEEQRRTTFLCAALFFRRNNVRAGDQEDDEGSGRRHHHPDRYDHAYVWHWQPEERCSFSIGSRNPGGFGPWALPALQRGVEIEQRLGQNLPQNFPVIDRFSNGVATSIKSLDLAARSYQATGPLLSRLNVYVNSLANFSRGQSAGVVVDASQITQRVLQVAIPAGGMTPAQQQAFQVASQNAAQKGVQIVTTVVR